MTMNNKNTFYFRQISKHSRLPYTLKKIIIHPQKKHEAIIFE